VRRRYNHTCEEEEQATHVRSLYSRTYGSSRSIQSHVWYGTGSYNHMCDSRIAEEQGARVEAVEHRMCEGFWAGNRSIG
jgi:hypothetical protein